MKRNPWWIVLIMAMGACSHYQESYPDARPAQREPGEREQERPGGLSRDTGMSLMDNGMILMLGMLESDHGKDSTVVYTGPLRTRP